MDYRYNNINLVDCDGKHQNFQNDLSDYLHSGYRSSCYENLQEVIRCPKSSKREDRDNMLQLCNTAISTMMMVARESYQDITTEHVRCTEEYFHITAKKKNCYRQNISQFLKILEDLKKSGKIVAASLDKDNDK